MGVYRIDNMRVLLPSAKIAEKNPDRVFSITGTAFYDESGAELSIKSKEVTTDMVNSEGFNLDLKNGILTISDGRRGRRPSVGASEADIEAAILAAKVAE